MNQRIKLVQQTLKTKGIPAYWCCQEANRRYLSGFTGSNGWLLIPSRGKSTLITDGRYQEQVKQESPGQQIVITRQGMVASLAALLIKKQINRVMVEEDAVTIATWRAVRRQVKGLASTSSQRIVEKSRAIKDADEIKALRKAVKIAETAFREVQPFIKRGVTEIEVALRLEKAMIQAGAEKLAFPTIVASGPNAALPHATPNRKKLKAGELVVIDFGCVYQGYHSDLTRTMAIARMTSQQQEYYKIVKKAQLSAQKKIVSGNMISESDENARIVFKAHKLDQFFVHSLGHGLGLEIHEPPRLSSLEKEFFHTNMVVTCEPGIYLPGWGGIRIEDDILVGEHESHWLSTSPATLQVIG